MPYRFLADVVVVFHLAVVAFVVGGGALVLRWRRMAWVHLPLIAWVIFAECFQQICPLTYLENWLRDQGGVGAYRGDFVAHYLLPVLYPAGLTPTIQIVLGVSIFVINVVLYALAFARLGRRRRQPASDCGPEQTREEPGYPRVTGGR